MLHNFNLFFLKHGLYQPRIFRKKNALIVAEDIQFPLVNNKYLNQILMKITN